MENIGCAAPSLARSLTCDLRQQLTAHLFPSSEATSLLPTFAGHCRPAWYQRCPFLLVVQTPPRTFCEISTAYPAVKQDPSLLTLFIQGISDSVTIGSCDLLDFVTVLPNALALSDSVTHWILLLAGPCPVVVTESDIPCICMCAATIYREIHLPVWFLKFKSGS